jgi:hypothetical protein
MELSPCEASYSRIFQDFMESDRLFPCSQEPKTVPTENRRCTSSPSIASIQSLLQRTLFPDDRSPQNAILRMAMSLTHCG